MSDIKITYAEDGSTAGIEMGDANGQKLELSFNYNTNTPDGGASKCKARYNESRGFCMFYLSIADSNDEGGATALTLAQMEALHDAIGNMVASIKGE